MNSSNSVHCCSPADDDDDEIMIIIHDYDMHQ